MDSPAGLSCGDPSSSRQYRKSFGVDQCLDAAKFRCLEAHLTREEAVTGGLVFFAVGWQFLLLIDVLNLFIVSLRDNAGRLETYAGFLRLALLGHVEIPQCWKALAGFDCFVALPLFVALICLQSPLLTWV